MENFTKDKKFVSQSKKYRTVVLEFYDHSSGVIRDLVEGRQVKLLRRDLGVGRQYGGPGQ